MKEIQEKLIEAIQTREQIVPHDRIIEKLIEVETIKEIYQEPREKIV